MEPTFENLLVLLAEGGVQFVLVGGVAVTLHGYVRLTEAVDILVERSAENISRLLKTLSGYGEGYARELCTTCTCSGEQVADAQHAAIAIEHACEWITPDQDFRRFAAHGLKVEMLEP